MTFQLMRRGTIAAARHLAASSGASDTFDRANASTLGTSSSGHTWSTTAGTWTIASNKGHPPLGLSAYTAATLDDGVTANATIQVTLTSGSGLDFDGGPIGHFIDINNFVFMDISRTGSTQYLTRTFQRVGGSFTGLTTLVNPVSGITQGTPFVAKLVLSGSGGESFINGVSMGTFSGVDGSLLSSTRHGVVFSASDGTTAIDMEDFSIS